VAQVGLRRRGRAREAARTACEELHRVAAEGLSREQGVMVTAGDGLVCAEEWHVHPERRASLRPTGCTQRRPHIDIRPLALGGQRERGAPLAAWRSASPSER